MKPPTGTSEAMSALAGHQRPDAAPEGMYLYYTERPVRATARWEQECERSLQASRARRAFARHARIVFRCCLVVLAVLAITALVILRVVHLI